MSISANAQVWAYEGLHPKFANGGRWHAITLGDQLNAGAFGGTSAIMRIATPEFTPLVAKLFNEAALPARRTPDAHAKLAHLARYSSVLKRGYTSPTISIPPRPHIAWPELVLYSERTAAPETLVGFAMPAFHGMHPLQLLYTPKHRKLHFPNASPDALMAMAAQLASMIHHPHGGVVSSNIVVTDLTPRNILISPKWELRIIDADSFQYTTGGVVYSSKESTPGFRSPAIAKAALAGGALPTFTREDDAYALAIVIFHLLVDGAHPWRAGSQFEVNGAAPGEEENMLARRFPYAAPALLHPPKIRLQTYQRLPVPVQQAFERTFLGEQPLAPGEWAQLLGKARAAPAPPDLGKVRPARERTLPRVA